MALSSSSECQPPSKGTASQPRVDLSLTWTTTGSDFALMTTSRATEQFFDTSPSVGGAETTEGLAFIEFSPTLTLAGQQPPLRDLLQGAPQFALTTSKVIDSQAILNRAVADAKAALSSSGQLTPRTKIHPVHQGAISFCDVPWDTDQWRSCHPALRLGRWHLPPNSPVGIYGSCSREHASFLGEHFSFELVRFTQLWTTQNGSSERLNACLRQRLHTALWPPIS